MLLVLTPGRASGPRGAPDDMPIGRAALAVEAEGIPVVFGSDAHDGMVRGLRARPGRWEPVESAVTVIYDRFPSQRFAKRYAAAVDQLQGIPVGNPAALVELCRDKAAAQDVMERGDVRCPAQELEAHRFEARLRDWGAGFLKPRFGAFGCGVRRVLPGDSLPPTAVGTVDGDLQPTLLQRAVPPPDPWAGISVRTLCQRTPTGWVVNPPVARHSAEDPVVNVHRGAATAAASDVLAAGTLSQIEDQCRRVCAALEAEPHGDWLVELGVDAAIASDGTPWIIEVNSRPRGRLEALAAQDPHRFHAAHVAACARPLRTLWIFAEARR